ncbi:hypothetical protein KR093_008737, partial [Drosophila rubida]
RVRKYPDKIPAIDWKYYRQNVRKEMVAWVKDFENKYDNMDSMFSNRHSMIDFSKYFGEVERQTEEVQCEVKEFKLESEKRIKILQHKMDALKCMKPYNEMTMEEFCFAHPDEAPDFINRPTFWPHTVEENLPNVERVHEEEESVKKPTKKDKDEPKKPPPKDGAPSGGGKSDKVADVDCKKPADPPKEPEKGKVQTVKAEPKESQESQMAEKVADLASKGVEFVKVLGSKAMGVLQGLWEKWENKRREVAQNAEDERLKKEAQQSTKTVDGDAVRSLASDEICHKTIIRGGDTAMADVKEHHTELTIEGEPEEKICKQSKKAKCEDSESEKKDDIGSVCYQKYQELMKTSRLSAEEEKCCEEAAKRDCAKLAAKQSEDESQEKPVKDENKCKPDEKASLDTTQKCMTSAEKPTSTVSTTPTLQTATAPDDDDTIIGMHQECLTAENEIFLGSKAKPKEAAETQDEVCDAQQPDKTKAGQSGKESLNDVIGAELEKMVKAPQSLNEVIGIAQEETVVKTPDSTSAKAELDKRGSGEFKGSSPDTTQQEARGDPEEIARNMFKMATGAAQLLSDAKKSIEKAHKENSGEFEVLKHAYKNAENQVNMALSQAYSALQAAKKLAHRAQNTMEANEQRLVATIEKHSMLAKLLANQAVQMQKEIAKLRAGLSRK